jgi:hypothetical protein
MFSQKVINVLLKKEFMAKESLNVGQWVNQHLDLVLDYRGKWVAISLENGIISANEDYDEMKKGIKKNMKDYFFWFVNENMGKGQSLMVRGIKRKVFTIKDDSHDWEPLYNVTLKNGKQSVPCLMLIDSGSDFTIIPYKTGVDLGFKADVSDLRSKGYGVAGNFTFVAKEIDCIIDDNKFKLPVGWMQEEKNPHIILGREIIFDLFDVEFKQREELVVFKWHK